MYIFRWLMKHPVIILALYFLSIVAILFSMTGGGSSDKSTDVAESAEVQKADSTEVDTSKTAAIEPSNLTSALVDGETVKTDAESTETASEESTKETGTADATKEEEKTSEEAVVEIESTEVADAATEEVKEATETVATTEEQSSEDTVVEEIVKVETATEIKEGSAAAYFKEHGVDSTLNTPAVVTENEAQQAPAEERVSEETTEVTTTDNSTDAENKTTETNDSQFSEMNADELLLMAREAYWNNGLEESAEIYQQLITASPDVVDYKGELGNVYWRLGLPEKAAELYAEISMPMIEAGSADKVANMVGFIGLFYPEKATEIHNKLQAEK